MARSVSSPALLRLGWVGGVNGNNTSTSERPSWASAAEISALFAVFAASVYALGYLALWLQVGTSYTGDLYTAWYAVSLVPKPVIAGLGVANLFGLPFAVLVALMIILTSFNLAARDMPRLNTMASLGANLGSIPRTLLWTAALVAAAWVEYKVLGMAWANLSSRADSPLDEKLLLTSSVLALIGALIGFAIIYRSLEMGENLLVPRVRSSKLLAIGLIVSLILSVVASLPDAASKDAPLSYVQTAGGQEIDGDLLAHVDGYWYIFDKQGTLVGVPDDKGKQVIRIPRTND